MKFPVKEVLIILYIAGAYQAVAQRIASLGPSSALVLYFGLLSLVVFCIFLAAYVESKPLRYGYGLILASSTLFIDSAERIFGDSLSYDGFVKLLDAAGFANDALAQHGRPIAFSLMTALLLLTGVALKPKRRPPLPRFCFVAAPAVCAAILGVIFFLRGGEGARGLPGAFTPIAYAGIYQYETMFGTVAPRQKVSLPRPTRSSRRDVVLIIDESIAPAYLDINHPRGVRSGLGESRQDVDVHNYGYAAAITNCSAGSNVTLRYGGTREDYRRINATMPSIWEYARHAGFRTVYIDAQRTGGELHNLMTAEERGSIDRFVQMDDVAVINRDRHAADLLAELLGNGTPEMILVNKVGGHFPVTDKFPDAFARHRPMLPRSGHAHVSDDGNKPRFKGTDEDWRRYRNSYRNALLWNVGAFFDRLFARADVSQGTLIYTSDHGQNLHEVRSKGLNTHCSDRPPAAEGVVPLVVIEGADRPTLDWRANLAANRNRVSHYRVFPTLLTLMGYDAGRVREIYGDSLISGSADPFTFNSLFYARLGRDPVWQHIDLKRLAGPKSE